MELKFGSAYYLNTLIGLGGMATWILTTWMDPLDDTLKGTLSRAFYGHSRTLTLALLSYMMLSVVFYQQGEWGLLAAISTGYASESLSSKIMTNVGGTIAANGGAR